MNLGIYWSDSLENLAEKMFSLAEERKNPFETECTVVGSPVMAGWLKQYFLYDYPKSKKKQKVLAGWNFKMLHPFVNDWLAKACKGTPVGQRNPAQHPYSPGVLQWRIWNELLNPNVQEYEVLCSYIGNDPRAMDRKRWGLAGKLAQMFDDYQNYRVNLLNDWAGGKKTGLTDELLWQAVMWRNLVEANSETYLSQFMEMPGKLKTSGISEAYKRITVFHTSAIPGAYMQFFFEIGKLMEVQMYIFNPSKEFWIEDSDVRKHIKELMKNDEKNLAWLTPPHPILSGFGKGTQAFLATVLDATEGNVNPDNKEIWAEDKDNNLLQNIQADIRNKGESKKIEAKDDGSIQFHACHGPRREVEVVKDLILKWFEKHPESEPRDIQVLVPDMETYAPFIESVFQVNDHNPPIPCSISKRPAVSAGAVGSAFIRLMKLNESRMTAPEVVEMLELDPIRERYGLEPNDVMMMRGLVNEAGIRWGRDQEHLESVFGKSKNPMPDTVTWRRGLDRLLAGFAVGRCEEGEDMLDAGGLGSLRVYDGVEGNTAELVGKLGQFFEDLCETAETMNGKHKVSEWTELYTAILERFFRGTDSSFIELSEIRRGIAAISQTAGAAGDPEVGADVMAAAIEAHVGGMEPAGKSDVNAVLFSPMLTMQVTPRKLIIMLGLNEGIFPRADQRVAFDLLAIRPRYGDRSLRYEDRLAFLEGLMGARERLIITYTGRNISNNKEIPPSPAVTEFMQYLNSFSQEEDKDGKKIPLVVRIEHKLHGFSPEYYRKDKKDPKLFSYSRSNYEAACVLSGAQPEKKADDQLSAVCGQSTDKKEVTLEKLQEFFVNPAKYFYTKVLQVRLTDPARDNVSDSEMFDSDNLEDYKINDIMLKDILGSSSSPRAADFEPGDDYYERFQEQSLIPLGVFGAGSTRRKLLDLRKHLNETTFSDDKTLYQALRALRESEKNPIAVNFECGNYTVSGNLPILEYPGRKVLLRFRYATIKPKDRVRAWLMHVVGHAAGKSFYTDLIGKKNKKEEGNATIAPLSQVQAMEILSKILTLYDKGCREKFPFAPACSYAYANAIIMKFPKETAKMKAYEKWDDYYFPEHNDPYLFDAWGQDGLMVHKEEFGDNASNFWEKYFLVPEQVSAAKDNQEEGHE